MADRSLLGRSTRAPRWAHDCDNCVFLGWHADTAGSYDIYVCGQGGWPTIVLRYDDPGPSYYSGAHLIDRLPTPMAQAASELMDQWREAKCGPR